MIKERGKDMHLVRVRNQLRDFRSRSRSTRERDLGDHKRLYKQVEKLRELEDQIPTDVVALEAHKRRPKIRDDLRRRYIQFITRLKLAIHLYSLKQLF